MRKSNLVTNLRVSFLLFASVFCFQVRASEFNEIVKVRGDFLTTVSEVWNHEHSEMSEVTKDFSKKVDKILEGQTKYVPVGILTLGQDEISIENSLNKVKEQIESGVDWKAKKEKIVLLNNDGNSSMSKSDPVVVIRGPKVRGKENLLIIDGHHELFAGLFLGSVTAPVIIEKDLSHLNHLEFWRYLKDQ